MISVVILSVLTLVIVVSWTVARRRHREERLRNAEIPLFAVPASAPSSIARPVTASATGVRDPAGLGAPSGGFPDNRGDVAVAAAADRFAPPTAVGRTREGAVSTVARPHREATPSGDAESALNEPPGEPVRYQRPADGTLQFLPGRLEVAAGHDAGQEIRFVRTPGPDGTCVTFGRADGAPYRHVQLREPTVSRTHARMTLEHPAAATGDGASNMRWRLENLSATNPVVVNGRPLQADGGPAASVILSEGDRIEMGEVAFVFRAR